MNEFLKIISQYPLNINDDSCPDGVCYHLSDIYLEELGKFGDSLKPLKAVKMLSVFCKCLASCKKWVENLNSIWNGQVYLDNWNFRRQFVNHLVERFFQQIMECSDVGIEPEAEEELENTVAFGLEKCEPEDNTEYTIQVIFQWKKKNN